MLSRRRCGTGPEFKPRSTEIDDMAKSICTVILNDLKEIDMNSNFLFKK